MRPPRRSRAPVPSLSPGATALTPVSHALGRRFAVQIEFVASRR